VEGYRMWSSKSGSGLCMALTRSCCGDLHWHYLKRRSLPWNSWRRKDVAVLRVTDIDKIVGLQRDTAQVERRSPR
jgi:hypothetical protein